MGHIRRLLLTLPLLAALLLLAAAPSLADRSLQGVPLPSLPISASLPSQGLDLAALISAKNPKLASHLVRLAAAERAASLRGERLTAARPDLLPDDLSAAITARMMRIDASGRVQVYVVAEGDPALAAATAAAAGAAVERVDGPSATVQAWLPIAALEALAAEPSVRFLRLPDYPVLDTGSVNSQGDAILNAAAMRTQKGVDGTGVKVGVISDGLQGLTDSQGTGDLPPFVDFTTCNVVPNSPTSPGAGAEGTAMLEIVHDLAPGAELWFGHFGFGFGGTALDFQDAVNCLAANTDVVVDDIGFFNAGPYDGSSDISMNAVNALNGAGRIRAYANAAGNQALSHYQETYVPFSAFDPFHRFQATAGTSDALGLGPRDFDPFFLLNGGFVSIFLQWNDPWGGSSNDYDLFLLRDGPGINVVAASPDNQNGFQDPTEKLAFPNAGATGYFDIVITTTDAAPRTFDMFIICFGCAPLPGGATHNYNTSGSSVPNNSDAGGGVISAGAINASDPGNDNIAAYSSRGPTNDGRVKPDVSGIDCVSITGAGGFPNPFCGTSAAAPHIAAIAALLLDLNPNWLAGEPGDNPAADRAALRNAILRFAVDLGDCKSDNTFGAGRADALASANAVPTLPDDTIGVYRPSTRGFHLRQCNTSGTANLSLTYGDVGDLPVVGDWNGDQIDTIGVYRPSTRQFFLSNDNATAHGGSFAYGDPGDLPVVGDWDGDGVDTIGVYRPSTRQFHLSNDNAAANAGSFGYGDPGDLPVVGDWDGDGDDTIGIYRPSTRQFHLSNDNVTANQGSFGYGDPGDLPVVGDWDGNGRDTIGVYRPSTRQFHLSNNYATADAGSASYGDPGDVPIAGDWDGP